MLQICMHANEHTLYGDYAFNSSCIGWKQNNAHIHRAKNIPTFAAVNIGIRRSIFSPKYGNIGLEKFYANRLTLVFCDCRFYLASRRWNRNPRVVPVIHSSLTCLLHHHRPPQLAVTTADLLLSAQVHLVSAVYYFHY